MTTSATFTLPSPLTAIRSESPLAHQYEVLAPSGNFAHIDAAIAAGADAIYVGLKGFSSRPDPWSLTADEIVKAAEQIHLAGRRLYVAINAEFRTKQESEASALLVRIRGAADAYIVGDFGLLHFLRSIGDSTPIHASCLLGVYNPLGLRFLRDEYGVRRVVLNTNLFIDEIAELHFACPDIELELIAHGGVCFHDSRRCRKPHYIYDGEFCVGCKQHYLTLPSLDAVPIATGNGYLPLTERRPELTEMIPLVPGTAAKDFHAETEAQGERLVWSPEIDLSGIVGLLMRLGVVSFKIEGRTRTTEYITHSTSRMRAAVDSTLASPEFQDHELHPYYYLAHQSRIRSGS